MFLSNMFGVVVSAILLLSITDIQGRYLLYRPKPGVNGTVSHRKIIATWDEAKQRCEREGAVLATPIDEGLLEYMKSSIGTNNHTTPYFIGMKAVGNPELIFVSVEGILLEYLPDGAIDMIEELDPRVGDCLSMDRYNIKIVACRARLPYLCYIPYTETLTTTRATSEATATTEANKEVRTQATTEASTEMVSQTETEAIREMTTQVTTEVTTESTTRATTEATTEVTTQATTEATTEVTTQATTEAMTEAMTEATTEETTEATTELTTQRTTTAVPVDLTGYKLYSTGSYYKVHLERKEWDEANSICISEGAYLVVINDAKEAQIVKNLAFSETRSAWVTIGLRDYREDGKWSSVHGDSIKQIFNTWAPSRSQDRFCGSLKNTGKLDDQHCVAKYPFVCERLLSPKVAQISFLTEATTEVITQATMEADTEMTPQITTTEEPVDLTGYKLYSTGSYYKVHLEKKEWNEANSICTSEGAYLIVINDAKEAQVVKNFAFSETRSPWVFIGLRDYREDGKWSSVHGDPIKQIFNIWAPSRSQDRFCGSLKNTGKLDDQRCVAKYPFVCERLLPPNVVQVFL